MRRKGCRAKPAYRREARRQGNGRATRRPPSACQCPAEPSAVAAPQHASAQCRRHVGNSRSSDHEKSGSSPWSSRQRCEFRSCPRLFRRRFTLTQPCSCAETRSRPNGACRPVQHAVSSARYANTVIARNRLTYRKSKPDQYDLVNATVVNDSVAIRALLSRGFAATCVAVSK